MAVPPEPGEEAAPEPGTEPEPDVSVERVAQPEPEPEPAPTPEAVPAGPVRPPTPPLETGRHLLAASFDLLGQSSDLMRRASFYAGLIAFGTLGPVAIGVWLLVVRSSSLADLDLRDMLTGSRAIWVGLMAYPAIVGLLVVAIESRVMAAALLGARFAGAPITVREALARSRMVFWRAVVAGVITGVPLWIVQTLSDRFIEDQVPIGAQAELLVSAVVAATIGAPFAYVLSGVVLGDVGPVEAVRRSIRVFRARKAAAAIVALFEAIAILLIWLGLGAGFGIATRIADAFGLGPDSGPAGIFLVTLLVAAASFAVGTLIYTVTALSLAPQVVMFVGLTHATMGLDHVRPGAVRAPDERRPGQPRFRLVNRPMRIAFAIAWLLLLGLVQSPGR